MNRQLTAVLVAVLAVTAVGGGAALFTGQPGGGDASAAADDASTTVEESTATATPTPRPTEQPTETSTEADAAASTESTSSDDADAQSAERTTDPPTAEAGANRTVREWVRVEFDATSSTDPDGDDANLTYEWTQVGGPEVDMVDEDTATPNFLAPEVTERTNYTFRLTVTDEAGATAADTVTVTVRPPKIDGDTQGDDEEEANNATEEPDNSTEESPEDAEQSSDDSTEQSDSGDDSNADDSEDSTDDSESAETSRDAIAQSMYDAEFESLGTAEAAVVEEFYLRQPDGEWDPSSVQTRDELAQDAYGTEFDELGFDARVDVQETFDAQFGDTGGDVSKNEISQAEWDYDFQNLSAESAGQITEIYDRQPWSNTEIDHLRTREQWAQRLYDADLSDLTREERLEVEQRYHGQFGD